MVATILSSLIKKKLKKFIFTISCRKAYKNPLLWNAKYDHENNDYRNALRPRRSKWCDFSTNFISYCSICSTSQVFP